MIYLLDTHYMLWCIADVHKLSKQAKNIITDGTNIILVSTVSFWEVSLKSSLGKLKLTGFSPDALPQVCTDMGFEIETLSAKDSSSYHNLTAAYHRDPFDRMLIWQAIQNGYTLISKDKDIKKYQVEGLKIIS